jgi:serine/threonine protein kinase
MKTLAEVSEVDSLYYFLKQSIRQLQQLHKTGISHGGIEPLTIGVETPYILLEGTINAMYAGPEVALGLAVAERYTSEEAVRLWKKDSNGLQLIERWIPGVAEQYSISALQKLIGTPMPEQQSDIWSLGISYLSVYDSLSKEEPFPEKESFFDTLTLMVRLRGRTLPIFETIAAETAAAAATGSTAPRSGRMMLTEPIRHGERNKTRRNPHN